MSASMQDERMRHKIAIQIVKARVPGYKYAKGDLNDEADLVPDVYIDNILSLVESSIFTRPDLKEEVTELQNQLGWLKKSAADGGLPDLHIEKILKWYVASITSHERAASLKDTHTGEE